MQREHCRLFCTGDQTQHLAPPTPRMFFMQGQMMDTIQLDIWTAPSPARPQDMYLRLTRGKTWRFYGEAPEQTNTKSA